MDVFRYQRRLPHWRSKGSTYFVTWRLYPGQQDLTAEERSLTSSCLDHFGNQRYRLLGYVVMNDHVHVAVEPFSGHRLTAIVQGWKSFTAHHIKSLSGRIGSIWQDESFDRIIRDERELVEKLEYIKSNPQKRWAEIRDYRWVWIIKEL